MKFFKENLKIIVIICLFLCSIKATYLQAIEKLILNMDVNKTLVAVDPASNQSVEQVINAICAEQFAYKWIPELPVAISYQHYIENYVFPGPSFDQELKKKRRALIHQFVDFVQETHHPLEKQVVEAYRTLNTKLQGAFVFPSFLKLIAQLKAQGMQYCIILRTFGNDMEAVASCITNAFPDDYFFARGYYQNGNLCLSDKDACIFFDNPMDAYLFFKSAPGHLAIKDDWKFWNDHNENREFSKKFLINPDDQEILSLFFDDNIKENSDSSSNIVDPIDIRTGMHLDISTLVDQKRIFRVNTFQAIMDEHYFIDRVIEALNVSRRDTQVIE